MRPRLPWYGVEHILTDNRAAVGDQEFARVLHTVRAAADLARARAAAARVRGDHAAADKFDAEAQEATERLDFLRGLWTE